MDDMDGFIAQLRGLVERGQRAQAALDALGAGRPNNRKLPARRGQRRSGSSAPMVSRGRVLGALEHGSSGVAGIAQACGMDDATGRSRASSVLHALKAGGLVKRRGKGKWGLTPAGQERVKTS